MKTGPSVTPQTPGAVPGRLAAIVAVTEGVA